MLKVKLIKVESNHDNVRTDEMLGMSGFIPEVGYGFQIIGEALVADYNCRVIQTTKISEVDFDKETRTFTFKTKNSTYRLEILDKVTDEELFSFRRQ